MSHVPSRSEQEEIIRLLSGECVMIGGEPESERLCEAFRAVAGELELKESNADVLGELLRALRGCADVGMALNNLQRFLQATPDKGAVRIAFKRSGEAVSALVTLFAGSQFLSDVLIARPDTFAWLISHDTLHGQRAPDYYQVGIDASLAQADDEAQYRPAIARWRRREYLRIGLRDLMRIADAEETSRDISDLAEVIIDTSARLVYNELAARFGVPVPEASSWEGGATDGDGAAMTAETASGMCVLGMGKLGGRELNFASDIDLIFIYEAEGETAGRMDGDRRVAVISNHDYFTRMGERLVKFLGERSVDGNLFRVDMRLRPEGGDGPLTRSLESFIYYLNSQARDWERLAYLKARVLSGPPRLTEKLYRVIGEFVFAGSNARRIVSEVQDLKVRIDREVLNSDLYFREVKRGYGGIREIEFVVSAMQIIHGYNHRALRVRNAFLAIQRLRQAHIISPEDADFYLEAYSFLRMVEHRLQMAHEAQTHTLPLRGPEYEVVARRCYFADGDSFERAYRQVTDEVHKRFTAFFEHDMEALEQAAKDIIIILDKSAPRDEALAALQRRGIAQSDALRLIHALAYGTSDVFVTAEGQRSFEQLLPSLLRLTSAAPFPEKVLSHLHSFAMAIKGITYYYEVIAHHPEILKLLVTLFGTSNSLSAQLIAYPEFFDSLISSRVLDASGPEQQVRRERMGTVFTVRTAARRLTILRRVVHYERLIIALQFMLGLRELEDCLLSLSHTADVAMELGMELACGQIMSRRQGDAAVPDEDVRAFAQEVARGFSIAAMGKYGGNELNFYGDLDVVFVYDGEKSLPAWATEHFDSAQEFYDTLADLLMAVMMEQLKGGKVFEVDARLRPYGKGAPITTELTAYQDYLQRKAETWELQAIHRARRVWGNSEIVMRLHETAQAAARGRDSESLRGDVAAMRQKLEESVSRSGQQFELKRSAGGIVDIEFLLQFCVITGRLPWQAEFSNYYQILASSASRCVEAKDAAALLAGYRILRAVENTVRIVGGSGESALVPGSPVAEGCARALGYDSADNMLSTLRETMAEVRRIYAKYVSAGENYQ